MELDRFDIQILRRLQADSRLAADAIGEDIGLSATAVQRRIRRLRSDGAIREEVVAHLSPSVLVLVMPSMQAYEQFTERVFFANDNIGKFRSIVVIEAAKQGLTLPVSAGD